MPGAESEWSTNSCTIYILAVDHAEEGPRVSATSSYHLRCRRLSANKKRSFLHVSVGQSAGQELELDLG
jgi:hypothetical protein